VFFVIVGSLTLSVGGIGVANIMYIVIKERTHEIGIKRSIGATRRSILMQFLTESVLLIAFGAAVGIGLSFGIVRLMALAPIHEFVGTPVISVQVGLVTMTLLTLVAMLAGVFPARRAAALDPIECLRD
jgi:putative ABC transport system permease protein